MHKEINQQLPTHLRLLLCYRKTPTLVALLVFVLGGLLSTMLLSDFDFREYLKLNLNTAITKGVITSSYYTGISGTIGDDEGTYYVNAFVYEYKVKGENHKWTSYSRDSYKKAGDKVSVKYNIDSPQYSVIKDYDYRPKGVSLLLLIFFPFAASIVLIYHIYKGLKFNAIINQGIITKGKVTRQNVAYSTESTDYTKITFTYHSDVLKKCRHEVSITTSNSNHFLNTGNKYIIFDKTKPINSLVLSDLPLRISNYIKKHWTK